MSSGAQAHGGDAVLLINLGSPASPTPAALRRYLAQFLSDPRVVELPRALWRPLLHGVILNIRPRSSARRYARIWSDEGSPLAAHTRRQTTLLAAALAARRSPAPQVAFAMRYGEPSIGAELQRLHAAGCTRVAVVPLYPQYSASTTASAFDEIARQFRHTRDLPGLHLARSFHLHPGYIGALAASVREHWRAHGRAGTLLMSFHGLPRAMVERGDPYARECGETARALAARLGLDDGQWRLAFQSRVGRGRWLEPSTLDTLRALGARTESRVDVICPGFVADCLETLEEIDIEGRAEFLSAGGGVFHSIACLNERADWIDALADIAASTLGAEPAREP